MSASPSTDRVDIACYDAVARTLHWLVAALAVIVVALALAFLVTPRGSALRDLLLTLHRSFGLTILVLMLLRIVGRLGHPPPPLPPGFPAIEAWAAHADHALLYLLFLVMPISGYVNAAAAGHAVSFFGLVSLPPLLQESPWVSQIAAAVHLAAQFLVYALVAMHVAAALMHRLRRRHPILERMLPPRSRA
jgi:cytochrome b561